MPTPLLTLLMVSLEILPLSCHRLITNPYPEQEYDSVIVSSDPITIREKTHNDTESVKLNEILKPQKRSYEECPQNDFACLYGNDDKGKDGNQIVDKFFKQYTQISEHPSVEKDNESSRKSYWTMVNSQTHNHPYDDKKGWVTLDPVPWSTSKISKWHPNKVAVQENKPWGYGPTTQRPVQQFWVTGSNHHTQRPVSHWGIGTNDLITDNGPSDFPTGLYHGYGVQGQTYHPDNVYQESYNQFHHNQELKGSYPPRYPQNTHPSTYPSNGNGEWILLSTTKGYSHPQRHRWPAQSNFKTNERTYSSRKIKPIELSKYHEENLEEKFVLGGESHSGNRKSDENGHGDVSTTEGSEKPPIQILYTGSPKHEEPVTTIKRKVRLQVLPSLESSSTSYGGLLEVDSSSQTVDEAQQEDEKMQKLKAIAKVKKNKIRGYELVPTSKFTGKGMSHKNVVTLAAVGAGMIPATMALLVPMALGRRKRSLSPLETPTVLQTNTSPEMAINCDSNYGVAGP